jgi:hypothetical protein
MVGNKNTLPTLHKKMVGNKNPLPILHKKMVGNKNTLPTLHLIGGQQKHVTHPT